MPRKTSIPAPRFVVRKQTKRAMAREALLQRIRAEAAARAWEEGAKFQPLP